MSQQAKNSQARAPRIPKRALGQWHWAKGTGAKALALSQLGEVQRWPLVASKNNLLTLCR